MQCRFSSIYNCSDYSSNFATNSTITRMMRNDGLAREMHGVKYLRKSVAKIFDRKIFNDLKASRPQEDVYV